MKDKRMESSKLPERFRRKAVTPQEAVRRLLAPLKPLEAESVELAEAWGRRLAVPVSAPYAYPPFRRSAMDGYAVRGADLPAAGGTEPVRLEVLETLMAGMVPCRPVGPGQASRIMTGAMMPEGADTVVMLEMTDIERKDETEYVRIAKPVPAGRNVVAAGSEFREGEPLFPAGRLIGPGETALLAAFGQAVVPVVRQPRVGVLSTGSELQEIHEPPVPGKIRNSNTWMLAGLIREAGGVPVVYGQAPDRTEDVLAQVRRGLGECDLLLTTGGVSVGDSDIMAEIIGSGREGEMLFNKVAMRPGSPTTAAVLEGKLLLALSGNPGACFVGFHLFAVPAIRKLLRCSRTGPPTYLARLAEPFAKVNAYPRFIRSRTEIREGEVWVRPTGSDHSGLMSTIVGADCLMVIPPLKERLEKGERVTAIPLSLREEGGVSS